MTKPFELETYNDEAPVAYIDLIEGRVAEIHSARQVVVEIHQLKFKPRELIFDLDEAGHVTGVELLG